VSPVRYELASYTPEDDILHSDCRENVRSYTLTYHFETLCTMLSRICLILPCGLLNNLQEALIMQNTKSTSHSTFVIKTNQNEIKK
jgi:glutaminase